MTTDARTAFERCLLTAFQLVLGRHDIALWTHRIARMHLPVPLDVTAQIWELALHCGSPCGSRVGYAAWVALVPEAIPDLLDVIAPGALVAPGPLPCCLVELPAPSRGWQRGALHYWARAVHAHDELQALLRSITPDAATAACLLTELSAAAVHCDWRCPPPAAPAG